MTVSNTISTTSIDVATVIETAYRRCRVKPELITADLLENARRALFLMLSALPAKGLQLWTVDEETTPLVLGQANYILDDSTVDVLAVNLLCLGSETALARVGSDIYIGLPDKTTQGRPTMFWLDRQRDAPVIRLWPTPDASYAECDLKVWRRRYIMDVGEYTNTLDVPQRWQDAVIAELAARLALETPQVEANLVPMLRQMADGAIALAQGEDKDAAPFRILPSLSGYTRR